MTKNLEVERKFLVQFPSSWEALSELFDDLIDIWRIDQVYLKPVGKEPCARIRKTIKGLSDNKEIDYHYNKKEFVESGVHEETEHLISKNKYEKYLKDVHPDKVPIEKTRFVFRYHDQIFELDVFKGRLKGLAILEIELKNKNDRIEIPPFLKVIEEATTDKRFNNFSLADKDLQNKL
jgi:CYTH domain-containing protein